MYEMLLTIRLYLQKNTFLVKLGNIQSNFDNE
jgi:hypothetical protein